jgi:hypothetical protein
MVPANRFPNPLEAIAMGVTADPALFGQGTTLGAYSLTMLQLHQPLQTAERKS